MTNDLLNDRLIALARETARAAGAVFCHVRGVDDYGHPRILIESPGGHRLAECCANEDGTRVGVVRNRSERDVCMRLGVQIVESDPLLPEAIHLIPGRD